MKARRSSSGDLQPLDRGKGESVIIVDPAPMARAGLRAALETADIVVAAEAPSCAELDRRPTAERYVVHVTRGAEHDLEALRAVVGNARILALVDAEVDVAAVVHAGGDGILPADADADAIVHALDDLRAGRPVLDPKLAFRALRTRGDVIPDPDPLTPRELEVLWLLSQGKTNPQIASRLFVAVGTVKVHVEHILSKLGASDRTDAAVRALSRGLLDDRTS